MNSIIDKNCPRSIASINSAVFSTKKNVFQKAPLSIPLSTKNNIRNSWSLGPTHSPTRPYTEPLTASIWRHLWVKKYPALYIGENSTQQWQKSLSVFISKLNVKRGSYFWLFDPCQKFASSILSVVILKFQIIPWSFRNVETSRHRTKKKSSTSIWPSSGGFNSVPFQNGRRAKFC